jgi:hypothetical protein
MSTLRDNLTQPTEGDGCTERVWLHPAEVKLIAYMRQLDFGTIEIRVVSGYPAMLERVIEKLKLL